MEETEVEKPAKSSNGLWLKVSSSEVLTLMTSVQTISAKVDSCSTKIDRLFDGQSKLKDSIEAGQNCSDKIEDDSKARDVEISAEVARTKAAAEVAAEKMRGEIKKVELMNDRTTKVLAALTIIATSVAGGLAIYMELARRALAP